MKTISVPAIAIAGWFLLLGAAPAAAPVGDDTATVIAPGPPALTRGSAQQIVAFLEFALDVQFNTQERAQLERAQAESWKTSTPKQREDSLQLARMQAVIAGMSAADRADVRNKVQPQLIATLRQTPDEPLSKFLLGAMRRQQQPTAQQQQPSSRGSLPAEVIGEWTSIHTSNVGFVNKNTGSYAAPSGDSSMYRIFADGSFEYAGLLQSSMYSCTMTVSPFERGKVRVEGNAMHFVSAGGTLTSKDNCNRQYNYEKQIAPNTNSYTWRMARDEWGVQLCLSKPGTQESCMYRK